MTMALAMTRLRQAEELILKACEPLENGYIILPNRQILTALHNAKIYTWKAMDELGEAVRINEAESNG